MKRYFLLLFCATAEFLLHKPRFEPRSKETSKCPREPMLTELLFSIKLQIEGAFDAEGDFSIPVRKGDSLYFAAIQFKELLVVINEETMESNRLLG